MKKITAFLLLLLLPWVAISQVELKGQVTSNIETLALVNVFLTDNTSGNIQGAITEEDGRFKITVAEGTYKVRISFLGYTDWERDISIQENTDLGIIVLEQSAESLNTVVVKSKKRLIEQKTDRLVFNVENSVAASGGNALEALGLAPGLIVQSNSVGMIGKGSSRVMVDGRILPITGDDLISYLNSISADDIKKIEIITNPPAKYEAAGSGGLINIIFKKGVRDSWKNSTTLSYNQNTYSFLTLRNNFFYNKGKTKFSVTLNGSKGHTRNIEETDIFYPEGPWKSELRAKSEREDASARAFLDYEATDNLTIGGQYQGNIYTPTTEDEAITEIFSASNNLDSLLVNTGATTPNDNSHLFNAHAIVKLDTMGRKISMDLDYFDFNSELERDFITEVLSSTNQSQGINQSALNLSNQNIDNFSAKVDIEHPLKAVNLSYGAKVSFIKSKSDVQFFNTISGSPVLDTNLSNEFEYDENIQAVYVNASKSFGEKWDTQFGLRLENTTTEGFSRTLNQTNTNDYIKLFPTIYINYKRSENHNFTISYGRRINRPSFRDLNPFRFFINSNNFSEGNPFLQPSFNDLYDFSYSYKRKLRTQVFLNRTTAGFGVVFVPDEETNTQIVTRRNYFDDYNWGIGELYTVDFSSWWQSRNSVYLLGSETNFEIDLDAEVQNGLRFYFSTQNTFSVTETTKIQANFQYSSSYKTNLFDFGETYSFDVSFKQSLLNKDMQISLLFNDIFDTQSLNNLTSRVNGITQVYGQNYSNRYARLSVSYSFGNSKINVRQRNFGNDEERRRTGGN